MIVFDLDDFGTSGKANCMAELHEMKSFYPNLKVTLFAIIKDCDKEEMDVYKKLSWIQFGAHGYTHNKNTEVKNWSERKWYSVLNEYSDNGFQHVFKAPNWEMSKLGYTVLRDMGWAIAVRQSQIVDVLPGMKYYCFETMPEAVHGHTWLLQDHISKGWFATWRQYSEFAFITSCLQIK